MGSGALSLVKRLKTVLRQLWWQIVRRGQQWMPSWIDALQVKRARNFARSAPSRAPIRRLFIDVSVIARSDAGTGIQRIVRAIGTQLLVDTSAKWEIHYMGAGQRRPYEEIAWPQGGQLDRNTAEPEGPGDVFLGLDFALDAIPRHRRQLLDWKAKGVTLWFVMYDLLPVQRPEWFSDQVVARFRRWLRALAGLADGFLCISPPVDQDLRRFLAERYNLPSEGNFRSEVFPMGWDLSAARASVGFPVGFDALLEKLRGRRFALMVGTLEPRKGHEDILNAFEALWQSGNDDYLVIVGRPGWKTERLQRRLVDNLESGSRLFWLNDASDEALEKLYTLSAGVIVASYGEGFGLPLIEAIGHRKPVLARDIPVFRMHVSTSVQFFSDAAPEALGKLIVEWLDAMENTEAPPLAEPLSWSEACASVKLHLEDITAGRLLAE